MSDTPVKPEPAAPSQPEKSAPAKRGGAVAAIADALKELFEHAPKRALGWVCAGVAVFVVLSGVGLMCALIMYGWPSMAQKKMVRNWELKAESGNPVVEFRELDKEGAVSLKKVDVPKDALDPMAWAVERFGEQKMLSVKDLPAAPAADPPAGGKPEKGARQ